VSFASTAYDLISSVACGVSISRLRNLFCHRGSPQERAHRAGCGGGHSISHRAPTGRTTRLTRQTCRRSILLRPEQTQLRGRTASELDLQTSAAQCRLLAPMSPFSNASARKQRTPWSCSWPALPDNLPPPKSLNEQNLSGNLPAGSAVRFACNADRTFSKPNISSKRERKHRRCAGRILPRILLTGSAGTASLQLSDLFSGPAAAWSFGPQISSHFAGGRNRA